MALRLKKRVVDRMERRYGNDLLARAHQVAGTRTRQHLHTSVAVYRKQEKPTKGLRALNRQKRGDMLYAEVQRRLRERDVTKKKAAGQRVDQRARDNPKLQSMAGVIKHRKFQLGIRKGMRRTFGAETIDGDFNVVKADHRLRHARKVKRLSRKLH